MTITQTVDIPNSRRLTIEIPREVPVGMAQVELKVIPCSSRVSGNVNRRFVDAPAPRSGDTIPFLKDEENTEPPLKSLAGAATPHADRLLGAAANLGNITLDEIREEKLAKHLV